MQVSPNIFREYDIRGVAGQKFSAAAIAEYEKWYGQFPGINITLEVATAIGRAYGTIIRRAGGREVVIGHEVRPFAEELTNAFIAGVRATGCNVTDLGVCLTPVVYFATACGHYDGGANVTGSHNVYFFNGFKLMQRDVWPISGEALQALRCLVETEDFLAEPTGEYKKADGYPEYKRYFLDHVKLTQPLKVVVDCGNGSAGPFAPDLLRSLGCEVMELYTEPDATFPNHVPDPEDPYMIRDLGRRVREVGADLGIGFDADADRVGFVTEKGEYVDTDLVLLLLAQDVLQRHPGKKILFEVKCSELLEKLIPAYGGIPVMGRTGHAPMKIAMRQDSDIILAGEVSGHFFFVEDYFKFDDGLLAAGRMLELLSRHYGSFSSLFESIPHTVRTPELKLPCADEVKFDIVRRITEALSQRYPAVTIDGIRFKPSSASWGLIRASNTSPYLTIRAEGATVEEVLKVKNIMADELEQYSAITDCLNRIEVTSHTGRLGWV